MGKGVMGTGFGVRGYGLVFGRRDHLLHPRAPCGVRLGGGRGRGGGRGEEQLEQGQRRPGQG